MKFTGGRMSFVPQTEVRLLELDGTVSSDIYVVQVARSDGRGHVAVKLKGTEQTLKVNQRKILPVIAGGSAVVIERSNQFHAICPLCSRTHSVDPTANVLDCCGQQFTLFWLGEQPVEQATTEPAAKPTKAKKPAKEKAAPRPPKREPTKIDLEAIKKAGEVWIKKVNFDQVNTNAMAYTIVIEDGENSRKLHFNAYNDILSKKLGVELPLEAFCKGEQCETKQQWFKVKDVAKLRDKLQRDGYEKLV